MEGLSTGVSTILGLIGDVWSAITGNPLLMAFAAAGLLTVGIGVFCAIKNAAR